MKLPAGILVFTAFMMCGRGSPVQPNKDQCSTTQLAVSVNDFGSQITNQLSESGNIFISPLSIYTALSLVYLGARGETAKEMETAFKLRSLGLDGSQLHEAFRSLLQVIENGNGEYSLNLANGLFAQQNYSISKKYIEDAEKFYHATVKLVNFLTNGEATKNQINKWVADKTANKITDFVQEPLDPSTILAILNAVYFKGIWKTQFSPNSTTEGRFYRGSGTTKKVMYMVLREVAFRFFEDPESKYKFLELPYKGEHIKMLLTLPQSSSDPLDLQMDSAMLCRINRSMSNTTLQTVIIPKFKVKYRKNLKQTLINLGIKNLFTGSANLSGIRKENDLLVSRVQHEAVLEVNEEGSEAAGVTGVYITRLSASFKPEFIANHPFLVHIIDNRNGVVLFSGQIVDPQ